MYLSNIWDLAWGDISHSLCVGMFRTEQGVCVCVCTSNLVGLVTARGDMCSLHAFTVFLQLRTMYMYSVGNFLWCIFNLLSFILHQE